MGTDIPNPAKRYGLVSQNVDEWGCGVACVASLTGTPYAEAKERLETTKGSGIDVRPKGLELHDIARALQTYGKYVVADWHERDPASYPNGTIVCVGDKDATRDSHHYMLKTPSGWMDPWHNMDKKPRKAGFRQTYPRGKYFLVALVPKRRTAER